MAVNFEAKDANSFFVSKKDQDLKSLIELIFFQLLMYVQKRCHRMGIKHVLIVVFTIPYM